MNLRSLPRFRAAAGAFALLLLAAATPAQTVDGKPEVKAEIIERISRRIAQDAYVPGVDFTKWDEYLKEAQPKIDAAKNDEEFQRAVNDALAKFGTSHLVLATPKQADTRRNGATVGVGIRSQRTDDGLLIIQAVKDAPAERAGIVAGDLITEVDGKKADSIQGIQGKEGSDVTLTVKHADGKIEKYILTRRKFSTVRPEELTWVDKDTAKLTIYTFDFSYDRERVEGFMKDAQKAKNLILDLRDNGGGAVINLQHLLSLLIPDQKPIGTYIAKRTVEKYVAETKGNPTDLAAIAKWSDVKVKPFRAKDVPVYRGHLAVLINGFSGSASEMAAAALRDDAGATIVGSKSAGAVLVSMFLPVSNGFQLQFPLSDYVTIRGVRLEGTGVVPDVEAAEPKLRLPNQTDEAVVKALAVFSQANQGQKGGNRG